MSAETSGTRNGKTKSKPGRPWWRPVVDGIDGRITPSANAVVRTNVFADTVATLTRLEVRLRRRVEKQSTWLLHQYNMATASDVRKMRAQLAAIEARLRDIGERLEDEQRSRVRAPAPRASAKRNAGKGRSTDR